MEELQCLPVRFDQLPAVVQAALNATSSAVMDDRAASPQVQVSAMRALVQLALRAAGADQSARRDEVVQLLNHLIVAGVWLDDGTYPRVVDLLEEVNDPSTAIVDLLDHAYYATATPARAAAAPAGCGVM